MIVVLYEHPTWSRPLLAELEDRGVSFRALHVSELDDAPPPEGLIVNRVGAGVGGDDRLGVLRRTARFLERCAELGLEVVNGAEAFRHTVSKVRQYEVLEGLGLSVPPYRVVERTTDLSAAAAELRSPLILKPNVGGSGGGVRTWSAAETAGAGTVELGPDGRGVLQEHLTPDDGCIVRVELLAGELLYALRIPVAEDCFDNCPVDLGGRVAVEHPSASVVTEARDALEACSTAAGAGTSTSTRSPTSSRTPRSCSASIRPPASSTTWRVAARSCARPASGRSAS